jgi:hypothetical protein
MHWASRIRPALVINTKAILTLVLVSVLALTLPGQDALGVQATGDSDTAQALVLVEKGVHPAPIVVFSNAPLFIRRAADELADAIEKISGARPEVIHGEPRPLPQRAIWVGCQPALETLFPEVDFAFQHPEETLIAVNEHHAVIAGRDRWDPEHLVVEGVDEKIAGKQQEYGTVNAVYTFLQDQLGVRWLWPGELGEDIVRRETIAVPRQLVRYHPQIRARGGAFNFSMLSNKGYGKAHDWTRRQRLQLGSLHPEGEPRLFHWHHHREELPALSDRDVTFANQLGRLLKERYPDQDYYVAMLSYGHSRPVPVEARPADNVIMVSVANFFGRTDLVDRGSTRGTTHREQFEAWGKLAPRLMWRPNTGSPAGWQQGLPDLSVAQTIRDLKSVADHHCIGIFIDSAWEHWATRGPQYYVMAQLIWDPSRDGQAVLDDYYARAFGPAAEHVRAYYELMEQARMAYVQEFGYEAGVLNLPQLYTDDLLSRASSHLQRAAATQTAGLAPDQADVIRRRIEFVQAGLAFTKPAVENIGLMQGYWKKQDETVAQRVRENWQRMEQIVNEHPYAINGGPVRPTTPRMLGLHPDCPNPKWKSSAQPKPSAQQPDDLDQN